MILYYIFAVVLLLVQGLVLVEAYRHLIYTLRKYRPKDSDYKPPVVLIAPCKGLDTAFDQNMESFFQQDYPDYEILFVVESREDPAYRRLAEILERLQTRGNRVPARILVAGLARTSSQKVHNLLAACEAASKDREVFAFVDSDVCLKRHWLRALVHPLRRSDFGASTGYRWFVPADGRLSSQVLSAINAYVASLLGPHPWNSAWGGSMAIRREMFDKIHLAETWRKACTDDYTLTYLVKKENLPIAFVPACFVASYEGMSWRELFLFARRQFIITRVYMPRLWWLAAAGLGHYLAGFWIGVGVTAYLLRQSSSQASLAAVLPAALWLLSMIKGLTRQVMIAKILPEDRKRLRLSAVIDIFFQPLVSAFTLCCVLAAGFTRKIRWRGICYHLIDADRMEIEANGSVSNS